MESEPVFKKFKHDDDSNNNDDDLLNVDIPTNDDVLKVSENDAFSLAHTVETKLTDTEINEISKPSVIIKEDGLEYESFQRKGSNLNSFEETEPEIASKNRLTKSLLPNELLNSEDKDELLNSEYKEDSLNHMISSSQNKSTDTNHIIASSQNKSTDTSSSGKSASINSDLKGKKKKRKHNKKCVKPVSPNYFVAVQVSNPEIHKAVLNVQKTILSSNKELSGAFIDVATLHITLFVIHIPTDEQLHVACSALDQCCAKLTKMLSDDPLCLKFSGISHFSNRVIFAQLVEDNDYKRFLTVADVIKEKFIDMGIVLTDERSLSPHLTIAKLSKIYKGKGKCKIRKIEPKVYASEVDRYFGEQIVFGLQLLAMEKPKDEKRYYYSVRETLFDFVPTESLDHSECCFPPRTDDPKNSKVYSPSSNKESVSSSSARTSDSSNTSVFFNPIPLKFKESFCNVTNLKGTLSDSFKLLPSYKHIITFTQPPGYQLFPGFSNRYISKCLPLGFGRKHFITFQFLTRYFK